MKVFILMPEKIIYEGENISCQVFGMNCYFQLLDHHASMIVRLKKINLQLDKVKSIYHIKNGMLEVKNGIVKIFIY